MHARRLTRQMRTGMLLAIAAGLTVTVATGMAVAARGGGAVHVRQPLTSAVAGSTARGKAVLVVKHGASRVNGRLDVGVRQLAANGHFEVLIEGVKVGDLSTNGGGNARARFGTHPRGRARVLGVDPRGKHLVVRDDDGNDVLEGDCPEDTSDAGMVACCVSPEDAAARQGGEGDDDPKCKMLTPDECDQVWGSSAGGSCLPDPCATTSPVPDGTACCVPQSDDEDGEGAECEDLTPDECSAEGGTMISASGCDPNPCEPTPAAEPRIVCCTPDGSGTCEHRSAARCEAVQGVNQGPGSCDPNPCEVAEPDPAHGGADEAPARTSR